MPVTAMTEPALMDIGINVALNKYYSIESATFALATDPEFLFTPRFQNELLIASGRQPLHHNMLNQEFSTKGTEIANNDDYSTDSSRSLGGRKRIRANVTRPAVPTVHTLPNRTITIGDDTARDEFYHRKAWVKVLEPKKQSTYPYTKGVQKSPPWWPAVTGPNKIRHKELDHLNKRERIILLMHIMGLILEEVTREPMATWFANREKPKNARKRGFLA
ncbi:hypothetical protein VE03_10152 [Pseudogymnoascus sp. 23342-1-I1]|nr:hypothetical protein VE03_10152 [Pseudogymnoascus sp. 23342-1-I1]